MTLLIARKWLKIWGILAVLAMAPWTALASPPGPGTAYLGGMLGLSSINNNVGSGVGFGLEGAFFFQEQFGFGAFLQAANHDNNISSFFVGGEVLYSLNPLLPGIAIGAILGSGKLSASGATGNSAFTYGGKLEGNIQLSATYPVTLGIDLRVMFFEPGTVLLTAFNPMATLKWWL